VADTFCLLLPARREGRRRRRRFGRGRRPEPHLALCLGSRRARSWQQGQRPPSPPLFVLTASRSRVTTLLPSQPVARHRTPKRRQKPTPPPTRASSAPPINFLFCTEEMINLLQLARCGSRLSRFGSLCGFCFMHCHLSFMDSKNYTFVIHTLLDFAFSSNFFVICLPLEIVQAGPAGAERSH
jgi:hypothetical protein